MIKNLCVTELNGQINHNVIIKGIFKKRIYVVERGKLKEIK